MAALTCTRVGELADELAAGFVPDDMTHVDIDDWYQEITDGDLVPLSSAELIDSVCATTAASPVEVVELLASSTGPAALLTVLDERTTPEVLTMFVDASLLRGNDIDVVAYVLAMNASLELDAVERLFEHPDPTVACEAASHPKLGPSQLNALAAHREPSLRCAAARHCNTPTDAFMRLARDSDWRVVFSLAGNKSASPASLSVAAAHRVIDVRARVANNPNTNVETLIGLARAPEPRVAEAAERTLKHIDARRAAEQ